MRVLIGYDGSGGAQAAIRDLALSGLPATAEALVLSVADVVAPPASHDGATLAGRVEQAAYHACLDEAAAWAEDGKRLVAETEPSWNVKCEFRADSPAWTILQRAESWKADLVVVGSTGRSSLGRAVFGSLAAKLLHQVPCALRVGRGRDVRERPGGARLVVGVDGSPGADAAVASILRRRWRAGSAVRVVTVLNAGSLSAHAWFGAEHDNPLAWLRTLNEVAAEKLSAEGLDAAPILAEGEASRVLVEEADSWGADCIFVGAHSWRGAERALLGSVAAAVAARAGCSVEIGRSPR